MGEWGLPDPNFSMPESQTRIPLPRWLRRLAAARRRRPREFWRETLTLSAVAMLLLLVELLGRFNPSEFFDAASAMILLLTLAMTAAWHRRLRLRWTRGVLRAGRNLLLAARRWRFEWGLDLRRAPPVPRGCPPALWMAPAALAALCIAAVVWSVGVGVPLRAAAVRVSYVGYLIGLMCLWSGLLSVLLIAAFLPAWTIMDMIKTHSSWPDKPARRLGWIAAGAFFVLLAAAALLLPIQAATLLLGVMVVLALIVPLAPRAWYPDCLWRSRGGGPVRSISLGGLFSLQLVTVALIPLVLVLVALGPAALGIADAANQSPISDSLGRATAWLAGGGLLVFLGLLAGHLSIARWHDPARPAVTTLHLRGVETGAAQQQIRAALAPQRWHVRFAPQPAQRTDVRVEIVESSTERATSDANVRKEESAATFVIAPDALGDPRTRQRIARRDVIQRRRMLIRGLESIFRRAARCKDRSGSGYWVAPHFWFVDGLTRDEPDSEETHVMDVIPPLYYRAFPRAARRHWFEVCRALEVDLIYVEDGIGFRNLRRVLRVMFERYDVDGGRQRLSDVHFAGLPKVRVMLHDYDFAEPPLKTKYPEPDYQHLGRVRILHVFRDRGGEEEQAETPEEPDQIFTPDDSPLLVG